MLGTVLVFVGGGLGAAARHGVNILTVRLAGPDFPAGTLLVNAAGGLAMGLLIGLLTRHGGSAELRLFAATGFLGGFTTFSAFSLDALLLFERGAATAALSYIGASVILAIGGAAAGLALARPLV